MSTSLPPIPAAQAGRAAPAPESALRRHSVRAVALAAIVAAVVYLTWRVTATLPDGWHLAVALVLVGAEAHATFSLALFTFSLWDIRPRPVPDSPAPDLSVAVLIATVNEPAEVLLPTVAAAAALDGADSVWVLDDGCRPDVEVLARDLGVGYLARGDDTHAKAGNLNHALGHIDADIVAVLDADHVPLPGLISRTVGHFADPQVALVQTPQSFYNPETFEYYDHDAVYGAVGEQTLFYRVMQPGKDRHGATFWCGTSALLRTSALRDVGGVATGTVTEDLHTSVNLHAAGYTSRYHNEVLAVGLAAGDLDPYRKQRRRWAIGAMQVLRDARPLTRRGLTWRQRVAYFATLIGWLDGWRTVAMLAIPLAVLAAGANPVVAPLATFVPVFAVTWALGQAALWAMSRRATTPARAIEFDLLRLDATFAATWALVGPRRDLPFHVTPKGQRDGDVHLPAVLWTLLAIHAAAFVVAAANALGAGPVTYTNPPLVAGGALWASWNLWLIRRAIRRVRDHRPDRRRATRFATDWPLEVAGINGKVTDVSLVGVGVALAASLPPLVEQVGPVTATLRTAAGPVDVRGHVVNVAADRTAFAIAIDAAAYDLAALSARLFTDTPPGVAYSSPRVAAIATAAARFDTPRRS